MASTPRTQSPRKIVVIGGALSGPAAAARAREVDEHAKITLLERNTAISYAVGGLAARISGRVKNTARLNQQGPAFFHDQFRIDARTGVEVTRLDPDKKIVYAGRERFHYDSLIYALGVESFVPIIPGIEGAANVFPFRNLTDLNRATALAARKKDLRVTILGGGYFGLEAADAFLRTQAKVTVVERAVTPLLDFSEEFSHLAHQALMDRGARVFLKERIIGAEQTRKRVTAVRLAGGTTIPTDLLLVTAGVRPRSQLLRDAGIETYESGTIPVSYECLTALDNVYACGVCAQPFAGVWRPQAAQADLTAQVAGTNAAGGKARLRYFTNSSILQVGDWTFAQVGNTRAGQAVLVQAPSREPFLPESSPLAIRLFYGSGNAEITGAEVAGRDASGVKQRIDILTTALAGKLELPDLAALDLAYQAPFSTARDAVNTAATVALATLHYGIQMWNFRNYAVHSDFTFVDVRTLAQRSRRPLNHRSMLVIPFEQLRGAVAKLPPHGKLIFLSETGREGFLAARIVQQHGFKDVAFLEGGLSLYAQSQLAFAGL